MPAATTLHLLDGRPWSQSPWVDPLSLFGCYTSFVVEADGTVVDLAAHLERLQRDSAILLGEAIDPDLVRRRAAEHVARVGAPVRLRVAVLARTPALQPQDVRSLHLATSSRPVPPASDRPWRVLTVQHERPLPAVKAVDPFAQLHHKRQARLAGWDDALFARGDDLLEGTTWGLVALTATTAIAPVADVLPSLGAGRVLLAAGLPVERRPVRREELAGLRLLLATTALQPVTVLGEVDGEPLAFDVDLVGDLRTVCAAAPTEPLGG